MPTTASTTPTVKSLPARCRWCCCSTSGATSIIGTLHSSTLWAPSGAPSRSTTSVSGPRPEQHRPGRACGLRRFVAAAAEIRQQSLCVKHFRLVSSRRTLRGGLRYDRIAVVGGCGGAGGRTWARLRRTQCTQTRGCEKGSGHGRLVRARARAGAATCPVSDAFGDCGNLEVR
jgi:hypothetical protein